MNAPLTAQQLKDELAQSLVARYGPLLSSRDLWQVLGYPSPDAYRQALLRRRIPVPLFEIEGRRGRFALAQEIAQWLAEQRLKTGHDAGPEGE